jgi:hypothetical protein
MIPSLLMSIKNAMQVDDISHITRLQIVSDGN